MTRHTSIQVYRQIEAEGLLSKRRFEVYRQLFHFGPLTQMEVARQLPNVTEHSITPRFAELKKQGAIK